MVDNRLKKGDSVPYAQVAHAILYHPDLSLKAKGLYSYMYAKPDNWNFTASSMSSQLKEGRRAILNILKELKEFGLLEYKKLTSGRGVYTIYSSVSSIKQPKCKNSTKAKNSQSAKTAPCKNSTVQKQHSIINKDTIINKDLNKNPDKKWGEDEKSSLKSKRKKQKLNLTPEEQDYKRRLINCDHVGLIGSVLVEGVLENVYIDTSRRLYTESRNTKQILSSTLTEIYKQLHELNEMKKRSNKEKLNEVLSKLK